MPSITQFASRCCRRTQRGQPPRAATRAVGEAVGVVGLGLGDPLEPGETVAVAVGFSDAATDGAAGGRSTGGRGWGGSQYTRTTAAFGLDWRRPRSDGGWRGRHRDDKRLEGFRAGARLRVRLGHGAGVWVIAGRRREQGRVGGHTTRSQESRSRLMRSFLCASFNPEILTI